MVAVCSLAAIVGVEPARAGGLIADAKCQKALAAGVRRVTGAALKGIEKCHRQRMQSTSATTGDCNDPSVSTGASLERLQRAVAKLHSLADRECGAAGAPATLGYDPCPAPCASVAIATYADVSECLACLAQDRTRAVAVAVFGTPLSPGTRTPESVCHATLVRATRKYIAKRMTAEQRCKTAESEGVAVGVDCRDGDYQSKISQAWARLQSEVSTDASCPVSTLVALDLCPSASDGTQFRDSTPAIDLLHSCIDSGVNSATNDLFDRVYAPGTPAPAAPAGKNSIPSRWTDSGGQSLSERNPRFRLIVDHAATVTLDLSSTLADAYLYLLNSDGSAVLAEDDNGGGGTDSRIAMTLDAGRYLLVAATVGEGAQGTFTVGSDTGALKGCFLAYGDADYAGASTLFCDGGTGEPFTDNSYASLRIPKGVFVRAYENADRSGQARTYYRDAPSLQPFLADKVSAIEWGAFDSDDFFVLAVSDSQITWSYCSDNSGSALCAQEQSFFGAATEKEVASFYNTNLTNALNAIKDSIGPRAFGGVIVNGDLTEFGKQDTDLEDYIALYDHGIGANVYPGLGNHDYANNVDDCYANLCASAMVQYFATQVPSLNVHAFDYTVTSTPQMGTPSIRNDYAGSLAYSWDIGNVHFVQLNNYPTYTRLWQRLLPNTDNWYDISASITWLRNDLLTAAAEGQAIVANLHDWGSADVSAFRAVLEDFPVSAVYGGHYHASYGRYAESGPYSDGKVVPVFLSGSAHYGTMLVSRFINGKLYVWVLRVDQFNGAKLQVQQGGVFQDVTDLSTLFDVCPGCTTTYEYAYDFR
jgi:cytolysin (calcineurin-like family phosphatase)